MNNYKEPEMEVVELDDENLDDVSGSDITKEQTPDRRYCQNIECAKQRCPIDYC